MNRLYLLGLGIVAMTFTGLYAFSQTALPQGITWGPVQAGLVFAQQLKPDYQCLSVQQPSNATIIICASPNNCYRLGDTILYQVTTRADPAIGTQRVRLVGPPAGCVAVSPSSL